MHETYIALNTVILGLIAKLLLKRTNRRGVNSKPPSAMFYSLCFIPAVLITDISILGVYIIGTVWIFFLKEVLILLNREVGTSIDGIYLGLLNVSFYFLNKLFITKLLYSIPFNLATFLLVAISLVFFANSIKLLKKAC